MKFFLPANYVCVKNTRKNVVIREHNVVCVVGDINDTELHFYFYPRDCNQTSIKRPFSNSWQYKVCFNLKNEKQEMCVNLKTVMWD
jgi:hypothetical protein